MTTPPPAKPYSPAALSSGALPPGALPPGANAAAAAMAQAFARQSPRLAPRPVPLAGRLMGLAPLVLFGVLAVQGLVSAGLLGWSVGVAYLAYDTFLLLFTAWHIRDLAQTPAAPAGGAQHAPALPGPRMGVIVAARNEAPVLGVTIDGLVAQAGAPELIILADDGSTDTSAEVLHQLYGLTPPPLGQLSAPSPVLPCLRWLRLPPGGKARALNAALPLVDTEIVLTVDADTLLAPGALAAMRAAFAAQPQLVAATGVLVPICGPKPHQRLFQWFQRYEYVRNFLSRYAWMKQDGLLLISGAFAAFRTRAVMAVGGFDPDCYVEDYELIHRLHRYAHDTGQDWRVAVVGRAVASTDAPATPMTFLRQRRRWFGGFLQTQRWNRDMVANPAYGKLGMRMLVVKALDTVQPFYGLLGLALLAWLVVRGQWHVVPVVVAIIAAKMALDLVFFLWSITLYRRWTGQSEGLGLAPALLAALLEPFSFQPLRHLGAAWGWGLFLTGGGHWASAQRTALAAAPAPTSASTPSPAGKAA